MARTVWTTGWRAAAMLLVTAAAHAGEMRTTLGAYGPSPADLAYTLIDPPDAPLRAAGVSLGRFDRVALAVSPSLADRAGGAVAAGYAGGIEVRLSGALIFPSRGLAAPPGRAVEGDAYDVFLAFFLHRRAPAADPRGIVGRADRPAAAVALLAGL